jgi:hypothetical protein
MYRHTALIVLLAALAGGPAYAAADVAGTWKIVERAKTGDIDAQLVVTAKDGALAGTYSAVGQTGAIRDVTVDGNELHFVRHVSTPGGGEADMLYAATVDGDSISGIVDAGGFGKVPFSGKRQ